MRPHLLSPLLILILFISTPTSILQTKGQGGHESRGKRALLLPLSDYPMSGGVRSISVSWSGRFLSAGGKGFVSYFHVGREAPIWSFQKNDLVDSLSMSPDGGRIVAGMEHAMTHYFSNSSSTPLSSYRTDGPSLCTAISEDGRYFTMGTFFGTLYLIDGGRGEPEWMYKSRGVNTILSVAISADAQIIAAGTSSQNILVFQRFGPQVIATFKADGFIPSLDISQDGRYLVAGSNGSSLYLVDTERKTLLWSYRTNGSVRSVSISRDGEYVAAGSYDGGVYLFKRGSPTPLWVYETQGLLKNVYITPNKDLVIAGGTDKRLRILRISDGGLLASHNSSHWITSVSSSYDGRIIAFNEGSRVKVIQLVIPSRSGEDSFKPPAGFILIGVLGGLGGIFIATIFIWVLKDWGRR